MDTLGQALHEVLRNAPYEAFAEIVVTKLAGQGVTLTTRERRRLVEHLKSNAVEVFQFRNWRWWEKRSIKIEVTAEEVKALHAGFTEFLEDHLPEMIESTADDLSASILKTLNRRWPAEYRAESREMRGFQRRLHQRWGGAIDRLRMSLTISREFGESVTTALRSDPDPGHRHRAEVLPRLHARACQVTDEVICLLSAGFADGAMARWRTLHEIAVVAMFLRDHGKHVVERYIQHQVVESLRAAEDYQRCCARLGYDPLSESDMAQLKMAFERVVDQYGPTFKTQYGWAADTLNNPRPKLSDIEYAIGIDHFRAHYRMASHNVHANPKGVFFKLGLMDEMDILLSGPSDAGLADPGHSTAISLMQVSAALGLVKPTLDSLVILRILAALEDDVGEAFMAAHQRLQDETADTVDPRGPKGK
jgi:hypothetical protein